MDRWSAQFIETDEINHTPTGSRHGLPVDYLDDARDAALALPRPPGANAVQILYEGLVCDQLGLVD